MLEKQSSSQQAALLFHDLETAKKTDIAKKMSNYANPWRIASTHAVLVVVCLYRFLRIVCVCVCEYFCTLCVCVEWRGTQSGTSHQPCCLPSLQFKFFCKPARETQKLHLGELCARFCTMWWCVNGTFVLQGRTYSTVEYSETGGAVACSAVHAEPDRHIQFVVLQKPVLVVL